MSELEPCPFCGSNDEQPTKSDFGMWFVFCMYCGAKGPQYHTKKDAIKWWNSRVSEEAKDA